MKWKLYSVWRVLSSAIQRHVVCGKLTDVSGKHVTSLFSSVCYLLHAGLLPLLFHLEDGIEIFFRNIGWLLSEYTALCPRRQNWSTAAETSDPIQLKLRNSLRRFAVVPTSSSLLKTQMRQWCYQLLCAVVTHDRFISGTKVNWKSF
jgi:hypothetical protein